MTKEELYSECVKGLSVKEREVISDAIEEFFSQNVVIPKGENRHPYADVYHLGVEGSPWEWSEDGVHWYDVKILPYKYRIKPQEPVYECQWLIVRDGVAEVTEGFYPYEDDIDYLSEKGWKRIEETKRVRQ